MNAAGPVRAVLVALSVMVLVGATAGCKKKEVGAVADPPKPVRIEVVGRSDIADVLTYPAELKAYSEVKIYSPVPDKILLFPWRDGDEVDRGERVALIKRDGLDMGIEQMSAQIEGLDAQIRNLDDEMKRTRGLLDAGAIAQTVLDKVETSYLTSVAQRKALLASRAQLSVTAGNAFITAPIAGVIANKAAEQGDMASPQMPLCRILSVDKLKVNLRLVETDISKVSEGKEVSLHLDAHPDQTFKGLITSILPYLERETRTNTVEVVIDNPKDTKTSKRTLKPGMFGRAEIVVQIHQQVVVAPESALLLDNELLGKEKSGELLRKAFVVGDNGNAVERTVKVGARNGMVYEIREGLASGERLVVRGQHGLRDGQKVEIVGEPATEKK